MGWLRRRDRIERMAVVTMVTVVTEAFQNFYFFQNNVERQGR